METPAPAAVTLADPHQRKPVVLASQPESGDFEGLRAQFGICRSSAYELERQGKIKFLRFPLGGKKLQKVLVDFASVRKFLRIGKDVAA